MENDQLRQELAAHREKTSRIQKVISFREAKISDDSKDLAQTHRKLDIH